MNQNQQQIQMFVSQQIVPWSHGQIPDQRLTDRTATQFRRWFEREAVAYIEEQLVTEAVASVLGAGNPATPFVVAGIKLVLDEETPSAIRFARDHQRELTALSASAAVLLFIWLAVDAG